MPDTASKTPAGSDNSTHVEQPATKKKSASSKDQASKQTALVMDKYVQLVQFVKNVLQHVDNDLKRMSHVIQQLESFDPSDPSSLMPDNAIQELMGTVDLQKYEDEDAQVVEGIFDGYFMVGVDQKKYPVPLNYASKSKLIPGDALKLKILSDGKFVYKLIRQAERQHVRAVLSMSDDNKYSAITDDGKTYFLNQAAVTFFKGKPGDELYIVINNDGSGSFAAIEAIIKK